MASECLRLELKPFGVRVVTAIVGIIKTQFFENLPSAKLLDDSIYLPIKDGFEGLATGESVDQTKATEAIEFARRLVGDVERGASGKVARGYMSTLLTFATAYVPTFVLVCVPCYCSEVC